MRFAHLIIGVFVIIFAWVGKAMSWAAIALTTLGLLQIILGLSQKHRVTPTPPPPPPPPKPEPAPKPEPEKEAPEEEKPTES